MHVDTWNINAIYERGSNVVRIPKPAPERLLLLKQKNTLLDALGNSGQQIVVVGDTSSGKSTTINFLLGFPINLEAQSIGTRRPCVISQVHDAHADHVHFEVKFRPRNGAVIKRSCDNVKEVADLVAEANDSKNFPDYFEPGAGFDKEPIYVEMLHKDFKYGLRLVDLPGLTRVCNGPVTPMQVVETYLQPNNAAILVIGKDDPNNGGFPQLAAKMARCANVLFLQNFSRVQIQSVTYNSMLIKELLKRERPEIENCCIYCIDYGLPKTPTFVDNGTWKAGFDQEDWQSGANSDPFTVQQAMWSHAQKLGNRLKREYPNVINPDRGIDAGIEVVLQEIIEFQFHNIKHQIADLTSKVVAMAEAAERGLSNLGPELRKIQDPPEWQGLITKAARVCSEFLDTTIMVPDADDPQDPMCEIGKSLKTTEDEVAEIRESSKAWIDENFDKSVRELLGTYAGFEGDTKLACLRSWHRLLDELTGMLAFVPMPCITKSNKNHAISRVGKGVGGEVNRVDIMVQLVTELNLCGKQSIRPLLGHFKVRLMHLIERDMKNAMRIFAMDNTGEIADFMYRISDGSPETREKIVDRIEDTLLKHAGKVLEETISGRTFKDIPFKDMSSHHITKRTEPDMGLMARHKENPGVLHWLLPFRNHYLNGAIPWKDLRLDGVQTPERSDDQIAQCLHAMLAASPPAAPAAPAATPDNAPSALPTSALPTNALPTNAVGTGDVKKRDLLDEMTVKFEAPSSPIRSRKGVPAPPPETPRQQNALNLVNLKMYTLCTHVYHIDLNPFAREAQYDLEVVKLLKAMQAEIAAFWASTWKGMLQRLISEERIKRFLQVHLEGTELDSHSADGFAQMAAQVAAYLNSHRFNETSMWETHEEITQHDEPLPMWPGTSTPQAYRRMLDEYDETGNGFPGNRGSKLAGQASWIRLCQEFIFVILQLSTQQVSSSELSMAKASSGNVLTAGPLEITSKLTLHRLQAFSQKGGVVFKRRMKRLYARDVECGLRGQESVSPVSMRAPSRDTALGFVEELPDVINGDGEWINGKDWLGDVFERYVDQEVEGVLHTLQRKFDELTPFDFTALNGRFPILRMPLRRITYEGEARSKVEVPDEDFLQLWGRPLRDNWQLGDKMIVERTGPMLNQLCVQKDTNRKGYESLTDNAMYGMISTAMDRPDDEPPEKHLAGGVFHDMALRVFKAVQANAIDYCRPRLKKMMAQIYQEEFIRSALQQSESLVYRRLYATRISEKERELSVLQEGKTKYEEALKHCRYLEEAIQNRNPEFNIAKRCSRCEIM